MNDRANDRCRQGWHDDPDNSGMCIRCAIILDAEPGEDPNSYRRSRGLPDVPVDPSPRADVQHRPVRPDQHGR